MLGGKTPEEEGKAGRKNQVEKCCQRSSRQGKRKKEMLGGNRLEEKGKAGRNYSGKR